MNNVPSQEVAGAHRQASDETQQTAKAKQLQDIAQRLSKLPEEKKSAFRDALEQKGIDPWKLPIVHKQLPNSETPLSFAQQRLWFVEQMESDNALYNLVFGLRFKGDLNVAAVEKSLQEIGRRHTILRTSYHSTANGEAYQTVMPWDQFTLSVESLVGQECTDSKIDALVHQLATKPFNLTTDYSFRFNLIKTSDVDTIGVFVVHHIAFDYLSVDLIMREFAVLYACFNAVNKELSSAADLLLPHLPIQYSDFADWQREWAKSANYQKQKEFWIHQLNAAPGRLDLPTDFIQTTKRRCLGKRSGLNLSVDLSDKLRHLAQQQNVTLYMLLLSLFNVLLHKYSQQNDICVGTSIANRSRPETENLLGFFVNLLVMRNQVDSEQSFTEFLSQVNTTATSAYDNQDIPFDHLVDLLKVPRDTGNSPLFQVLFVLTVGSEEASHSLPNLKVSSFHHDQGIARYELTLRTTDLGAGTELCCQFEYDRDLYHQDTIDNLLAYYQTIAYSMVMNPGRVIGDISLLSSEQAEPDVDCRALTEKLNNALGIHGIFEQLADTHVDKNAVVFEHTVLSYGELNAKANQLAHYLRKNGISSESRVALYLDRSPLFILGILGILKAGGAYVPLDTKWPSDRINGLLSQANVDCVLSEAHWRNLLSTLDNKTTILLDDDGAQWQKESEKNLVNICRPEHAAYVVFTSGSTGVPKGVVVEHQQIMNYTLAVTERLDVTSEELSAMNFAHISTIAADLGNTMLFGALCSGGCLHLISNERAFDADRVAQYMDDCEIDVLKIVPSHLQGLFSVVNSSRILPNKILMIGGEACSTELLKDIRIQSPELRIINHYGPTETTVGVLTHEIPRHQTLTENQRVPLGKPLINNKTWVLDTQLQPCPIGVIGELYIGGAGVARGYLDQPELTSERFIKNPLADQHEQYPVLYRTGDRARLLTDGNLEFIGRIDNQVKIRGYRVELGDIETHLKHLEDVTDACVINDQSRLSDQLIAFVVLDRVAAEHDDRSITITQSLASILPEYMVPQTLIVIDELPLNANGKIDAQQLKVLAKNSIEPSKGSVAREPSSDTEQALASIWCQVLKREKINVDDDFFQLGGDSILSLQVIARAKKAGLKITPKQLFEQPTIAQLSAVSASNQPLKSNQPSKSLKSDHNTSNKAELPWTITSDIIPLTPIQQWFFDANHPDKHHWNQSKIFQVNESLEFSSLKASVNALINHHDALRLRFQNNNGHWQQTYKDAQDIIAWEVCQKITPAQLNITESSSEQEISFAIEQYASTAQKSLDLKNGPLVSVVYFSFSDFNGLYSEFQNDRLLIIVHHLAVDGVSWRILLNDLQRLYQQARLKQPLDLGPKSNSFQQWSERLIAYSQSSALFSEIDYWNSIVQAENFSNNRIGHTIDNNSTENTLQTQASVTLCLSAEQTSALIKDIPVVYSTQINDILLAALTSVVCDKNENAIIELEGHGRENISVNSSATGVDDIDLSQTVGWFTSRFPVLLTKHSNDWSDLIRGIKHQLKSIPNKGIGYGVLRYLSTDKNNSNSMIAHPNPPLCFNYLGQFDNLIDDRSRQVFTQARETTGENRALLSGRHNPLELISQISNSQLSMTWQYSTTLHSREWVETLANNYRESLLSVIQHCLSEKKRLNLGDSQGDSQLQLIRPATGSSKSAPLYCLPHRGGHTLEYREIVSKIDPSIPVFGIQSKLLSDPNYRQDDISVVAQQYANLIQKNQPKGPYRLLGWSLGGVLSMAIAKALEDRGEVLSFIGLVDAILPQTGAKNRYDTDSLLDNLFVVFGDQAIQRYRTIAPEIRSQFERELEKLDEEQSLNYVCDWSAKLGLVDESVFDRDYIRLKYRSAAQSQRLIHSFIPCKLKASIAIWWAQDSLINEQWPSPWDQYCDAVVFEEVLPSTHFTIVTEPKLFESLATCLKPDSLKK